MGADLDVKQAGCRPVRLKILARLCCSVVPVPECRWGPLTFGINTGLDLNQSPGMGQDAATGSSSRCIVGIHTRSSEWRVNSTGCGRAVVAEYKSRVIAYLGYFAQ